jgi:hypothetical protein
MRLRKIRLFALALCTSLSPLAMVSPARADLVLGFPHGLQGPPGTAGWSTYGDSGSVSTGNSVATINDNTSTSETDVYINFTVPVGGAQILQFTINSVSADSSYGGGIVPFFEAAFGVVTPDMTGNNNPPTVSPNPQVPTVVVGNQPTDSYFAMDVVTSPNPPSAATGVTVSYPAGVFAQVSVDLPSSLVPYSAGVLFRLNGGSSGDTGSSVTISNVEIVPASVPEPSSIIPGLTAVLIVAGVLGTRSRRGAVTKTHRIAA